MINIAYYTDTSVAGSLFLNNIAYYSDTSAAGSLFLNNIAYYTDTSVVIKKDRTAYLAGYPACQSRFPASKMFSESLIRTHDSFRVHEDYSTFETMSLRIETIFKIF